MISASVDSRCTTAEREAKMSETMKAAAAKSRARLLASMATRVSFWRIERSRRGRMSRPRARHQGGQLQELRAHLELGLLRADGVDLEAHPARRAP